MTKLSANPALRREPSAGSRSLASHWDAGGVIGKLRKDGAPAHPAMIKDLENGDAELQYGILLALGDLGPVASEAAPAIIRAFASPSVAGGFESGQ